MIIIWIFLAVLAFIFYGMKEALFIIAFPFMVILFFGTKTGQSCKNYVQCKFKAIKAYFKSKFDK